MHEILQITREMGCFGLNRFHWIALFVWQSMSFFGSTNLFPIFSNLMPEWRCGSGPFNNNCSIYKQCRETITFAPATFHSNAYEMGWYCNNAKYAAISNQVQFFGNFFGTILFGFASDMFGRKIITIFTIGLGIISTAASGLLHHTYLIFTARFFIGLAIGGTKVVGCTFIMEMLPSDKRMFSRAYFNWGISRMLLTAVCFFTQEWRAATFAIAVCCMPALLGRLDEMRESEKKIARVAGVPYVPVNHPTPDKPKSLVTLIRSGLWRRLIVLWAMWFTAANSTYATDLASSRLAGNLYLNQFLFGLVIYISKVILGIVDSSFPSFSRRILHQGSQAAAITCFGALAVFKLLGHNSQLLLVLNIVGIVFVEYTWDACYLCAIEGVETTSRASAIGSSSFVARIGMLLSPLLVHLDLEYPGTVYMVIIILGSLNLIQSYLFLVETKGVKLDEVHIDGAETKRDDDDEMQHLNK